MNFLNKIWSIVLTDNTKTAIILDLKEQLIIANSREVKNQLNSKEWEQKYLKLFNNYMLEMEEASSTIKNNKIMISILSEALHLKDGMIFSLKEELGLDDDDEIEISPLYNDVAINAEIERMTGGEDDR